MREILALLPKPSRYLGIEEGAVIRDPGQAELHCALAFPDMYEVAMSYLGQKIIYGLLNETAGVYAERVFTPCREAAAILRERGVLLATLESDTDLAKTHLLGFHLTHELAFTNILYMLDLAGIPLRAERRGDDLAAWPLVIAGGGCAICAEPLAPYLDLLVLGEAEAALPGLCDLLKKARREGWRKSAFLRESRHLPGVYVPSLFTPDAEGKLQPVLPDYTEVKRPLVRDFRAAWYPVRQVVPIGAVHNRLSLEIARGCTRGCRFCQAGMTTRPSRERAVEDVTRLLEECLQSTGYEDVSFLSLSSGDFSGLRHLFLDVCARCAREQVSVSLPSLRVGSVDGEIMAQVAGIRRTGATLAPEAGTQRLRDVINKGVTEQGLLRHVRHLGARGWQQLKLYFMIGLPTETDEDLDGILDLCLKARDACRTQNEDGKWFGPRLAVTASISPFVPKTHTPFQWEAQIGLDEMKRRIFYLRERCKRIKGLTLRWHLPEMSHLEGILSRAGRELAPVLESAYRNGALFDSWVEGFSLDPWLKALEEHGLSAENLTGARDPESCLPWDHLHTGVRKAFLRQELDRAKQARLTDDCRYHACRHCGVCDTKAGPSTLRNQVDEQEIRTSLNYPERDQSDAEPPQPRPFSTSKPLPAKLDPALTKRMARYRIWHAKLDKAAWLSQLELQTVLERAMRKAELPLAFSQGFHPLPLLSFARALPVGVGSLAEWFAITLRRPMSSQEVMARLAPKLLPGLYPTRVELLPLTGALEASCQENYRLSCPSRQFADLRGQLEKFQALDSFKIAKENKKGKIQELDLRALLAGLSFTADSAVLSLDWSSAYCSPLRFVQAILPELKIEEIQLCKLEQFFLSA